MFDLDAAVVEANPEPFRFTWGGETFELPAVLALPIDRQLALISAIDNIEHADVAQIADILNLLVGQDLLARLSAVRPLSTAGLMKLIEAWMAHQSGDLGKSPASPVSSVNGVRLSKPISRSGRAPRTS